MAGGRLRSFLRKLTRLGRKFDYADYWERRYASGGNSGAGSYGVLAQYKAEVINGFIRENRVASAIEFGCGDGNQLQLIEYPTYLGLDVSAAAIDACRTKFKADPSRSFMLYRPGQFHNRGFLGADLVVCLDVLYHVTDEADYRKTLADMFSCARDWVILYTNVGVSGEGARRHEHVVMRDTLQFLKEFPAFAVTEIGEQEHPHRSFSNFIFLRREGSDR
ncbi:MAG: class I SAM-dependent methyltransferase [Planctomycetota bacterium]|jgi:SAM-dependent methyltransferase